MWDFNEKSVNSMSEDIVAFCEVALSLDRGRARATVAFHLRCVRSDLNEHVCVYGLGLARGNPTRCERERAGISMIRL